MGIPKNFDLTEFESISAYDDDFSNDMIYFSIENTTAKKYFNITNLGKRRETYSNYFTTRLTTLENVMAPFTQEFLIMATVSSETHYVDHLKINFLFFIRM